ncbi:right-handed parallel beta-helix repeat-containing protein [Bacillus sp. ISL-37]|uniref:right-handed parallel beta-helix repeat-containing protein n=1 Tax=Bacillus sp. ISL-37 TaxID=2819123 RepID=UPI001BE6532F|nr:right-handed parallel beta-helix repeat-containing protein [Bacillus sp. ISL-37]MBT2682664.1 right-handed parallel beta-helix repeat-containing protein [Bacillus sp. ISL-37]
MGKYRTLGTFFDRIFRNDLNSNFNDIDADVQAQKARVDNLITATPQPSEVVDARGGAPVLRDRLDGVDEQLAENEQDFFDRGINVRRSNIAGDGVTDVTADFNSFLTDIHYPTYVFIPKTNGSYMISSTISINNKNILGILSNGATIDRIQSDSLGTNYNMIHADNLDKFTLEGVFLEQDEFDTGGDASNDNHRGVYASNCRNVTVTDCKFSKTGTYATEFYNCQNVVAEQNEVTRSTRKEPRVRGAYGFAAIKCKNVKIQSNHFENLSVGAYAAIRNGDGDFYEDLVNLIVTGNTFVNLSENNFYGEGYQRAVITNNVLENVVGTGIKIRGRDVVCQGNVIHTKYMGIGINEASGNLIVTGNKITCDYDSVISTQVLGIEVTYETLLAHLANRGLDSAYRAKNVNLTDNILDYVGSAGETSYGIRMGGSPDYTAKESMALQNVLVSDNTINNFLAHIVVGYNFMEKTKITDNILIGQEPIIAPTNSFMGAGILVNKYTPNLLIENNFIQKCWDGIRFGSGVTSIAYSNIRFNTIVDNNGFGIKYSATSGFLSHFCEKNIFRGNVAGNFSNPPQSAVYQKRLVGTDATGTNVFSTTANTLGKNAGFINMYDADGNIVFVPYWTSI